MLDIKDKPGPLISLRDGFNRAISTGLRPEINQWLYAPRIRQITAGLVGQEGAEIERLRQNQASNPNLASTHSWTFNESGNFIVGNFQLTNRQLFDNTQRLLELAVEKNIVTPETQRHIIDEEIIVLRRLEQTGEENNGEIVNTGIFICQLLDKFARPDNLDVVRNITTSCPELVSRFNSRTYGMDEGVSHIDEILEAPQQEQWVYHHEERELFRDKANENNSKSWSARKERGREWMIADAKKRKDPAMILAAVDAEIANFERLRAVSRENLTEEIRNHASQAADFLLAIAKTGNISPEQIKKIQELKANNKVLFTAAE